MGPSLCQLAANPGAIRVQSGYKSGIRVQIRNPGWTQIVPGLYPDCTWIGPGLYLDWLVMMHHDSS